MDLLLRTSMASEVLKLREEKRLAVITTSLNDLLKTESCLMNAFAFWVNPNTGAEDNSITAPTSFGESIFFIQQKYG